MDSVGESAIVEVRLEAVRIQERSPKSAMIDVTRGPDAFQRIYSGSSGVHPMALLMYGSLLRYQLSSQALRRGAYWSEGIYIRCSQWTVLLVKQYVPRSLKCSFIIPDDGQYSNSCPYAPLVL